jgi:hypothetical protein
MANAKGDLVSKRKTQRYLAMAEEARKLGESNDCSVKALAIVCNVSYKKARATLRKAGRKTGQRTYDEQVRYALFLLNHRIVRTIRRSDDPEGCRTLRTIENSDAVDGGAWWINVAGHSVGMVERTIHDHAVGCSLRIRSARKIVKIL